MTHPSTDEVRDAVSRVAKLVTAAASRKQAAYTEAKQAEAALLATLLQELAGPALTAISGRLQVSSANTFESRSCCLLAGDATPRRAAAGTYLGKALYCLTDGELVAVEYAGSWQPDDPSMPGTWTASLHDTAPREAVQAFRLDDVVARLSKSLQATAEGNSRAADDLDERAKRVAAISLLLRR
ncbi:hypothetical protein NVS55_40200 (plasmid) [Myxococcus stipitatus]|uniref:hypothetical protein n=1 Tax=Myxococcus stipitatus TaxID=83455 RepID=UPI003144F095